MTIRNSELERLSGTRFAKRRVREIIDVQPRTHRIKTNEYLERGLIPVVDQGAAMIAGYINDVDKAYSGPLPVVIFGDHNCSFKFANSTFAVGADGTQLLTGKPDIDTHYLYYALQTAPVEQFGYQRHFKLLKECEVPVPLLGVQRCIVSILRAYDDLIEINRQRIALLEGMARQTFANAVRNFRESSGNGGIGVAQLISMTLGGDWGEETATPDESLQTRVIRGTDFRRIQSGDFSTAPTRFISERSFNRRLLRPFDVVVENSINAKARNAGTPLLISAGTLKALGNSAIATSFCRLFRCNTPENASVLFNFMDWMQHNNEMQQFQVVAANGIANFQSEHFMKRAVVPLSPEMIESLGERLAPFSSTTFQEQISNLSRQRDLLLPRLISGELALSGAERELEAVV